MFESALETNANIAFSRPYSNYPDYLYWGATGLSGDFDRAGGR